MAIINGVVVIDETSGEQHDDQGGVTANDFSSLSGPSLFEAALTGITGTRIGLALSGFTGSGSGSTVLTFGTDVQDVFFAANAQGAEVNGLDSGLKTLDGTTIYLYTSLLNNNVLLGRVGSPTGDLAFALYLDTVDASGISVNTSGGGDIGATGAKLWVAQYQPIQHIDDLTTTLIDESVVQLLTNKIFVGSNSLLNFSLAQAPSGQNLFLMVGDNTPATGETAIVITGLTASDTVNTSQAGSNPIVVGTNNQMIVSGKGINVSSVTLGNGDSDFVIPNLTHTEATDAAHISFDAYLASTGGGFTVVQTQPNNGPVKLLLEAFNDTGAAEQGTAYFAGFGDDTPANIISVKITRGGIEYTASDATNGLFINDNGTPNNPSDDTILQNVTKVKGKANTTNVTVDFSGDKALIVGLLAHDEVDYIAASHTRIRITNAANSDGTAFDIGEFSLRTGSLTAEPLGDVAFVDDEPTAVAELGTGSVTHDETADLDTDADDIVFGDTGYADVVALFDGIVDGPSSDMTAAYAQGSASVVDSSGSSYGQDEEGGTTVFSLGIADEEGTDSGLTTTDGVKIYLFKEGDLVVGRIGATALAASTGAAAFAVAIDADSGVLSLAQYASIAHDDDTEPDDVMSIADEALFAIVTVTDGDGDEDTDSVDIGDKVAFEDDGPTADAELGDGSVTHDETAGRDDDADDIVTGDTGYADVVALFANVAAPLSTDMTAYAQGSASVVNSSASTGGVDGLASTAYSLDVSAAGVDSGLTTTDGVKIYLFKENDLVVGRIGNSAGAAAFAVAIDADSGVLSLAQYAAIAHDDDTDPDDVMSIADEALFAIVTVTDGDGDEDTDSVDIGDRVAFEDDGPTLTFGNLVGTGTDLAQYGFWMMGAGADGPNAADLQITLTGFQLGGVVQSADSFSLTEGSPSPDGSGNYKWTGSLTGDFDSNGTVDANPLTFTLTARADGKYALDLSAPNVSTTTTDTADGGLGAGGPDAVQTLRIPALPAPTKETVVFLSAKISATTADIAALIGPETGPVPNDPTEVSLEASLSPFIDFAHAMNVSTSGIGVSNNVLEGDSSGAIGGTDESFVVNPLSLVNTVRVFIDNSVSGYKYTPGPGSGGNERLYYTAYYSDGTNSGAVLVNYDINTGSGTPKFFEVNGGAKLIDAVQLTMAKGDVKIPNIQFVTVTESLAKDISLDFTASLTDKDGDTASSNFSADLFTNEAANAAFDYELIGTALAVDAFDVDLASTRNDYQISGFDVGATRDKLVLIGDQGAVVHSIDNSGANSIVTIDESGTQTTTITVVGVDLQTSDIVIA